jgi:hypothetical protein
MGILPTAERYTCQRGPDPSYPSFDFARNVDQSTPAKVSTPANQDEGPIFCIVNAIRSFGEVSDAKTKDKEDGNVLGYRNCTSEHGFRQEGWRAHTK